MNEAGSRAEYIAPDRRKEYKLDELLGGITGKNRHLPADTGASVDKEVWQCIC